MNVLVACEFSGVVRDAFIIMGHDAVSCDLLPSETKGRHHVGNVEEILNDGWDMMIGHPPCTYLASSGLHWTTRGLRDRSLTERAIEFVSLLMSAPIEKICIENPVGIISSRIRKPDQIIQPYEFGEDASKKTCLWLKGLPALRGTKYCEPRMINGKSRWGNQCASGQNKLGPNMNRWKQRSVTYPGIAAAMAEQWGE